MKNKFKQIFLIVLVVVMGVLFAACDIEAPISTSEATSTPGEDNGKTPSDKQQDVTFSIDNTEQTNDKWKMTYKGCEIKDKLDSFTTATEGKEFLIVFFEIENISEKSNSLSIMCEQFYVDGVKAGQTIYGISIDGSVQIATVTVESGRKANGYFLFQVSPDWKELEIIYDDDFLHQNEDNVIKFTLTKIDN